jgi:hypothetical protein
MIRFLLISAVLSLTSCIPGVQEPLPVADFEIDGLIWLRSSAFTITGSGTDLGCKPNSPWNAINGGETVTARDLNGTLVGRAKLSEPKLSGSWDPETAECWITFDMGLADAPTYTFDLAGVQTVNVSQIDLRESGNLFSLAIE